MSASRQDVQEIPLMRIESLVQTRNVLETFAFCKQPDTEEKLLCEPFNSLEGPAKTNDVSHSRAVVKTQAKQNYRKHPPAAVSTAVKTGDRQENEEVKLTVSDFELLTVVGLGYFVVTEVILVRKKSVQNQGRIYAMKVLRKSVIVAGEKIEQIMNEREILLKVNHPFIVRLRYAFQSEAKLYLVTGYFNTLFYHLRRSHHFTEERARFYGAELLSALVYLHQNKIIHLDLKPDNVLIDKQGHVILTDFGLSKQNFDSSLGTTTFCGTPEYFAPELLMRQRYGPSVDWWCFGILMFEMMVGCTPFKAEDKKSIFSRILHTEPCIPPFISPKASYCVRGLLRANLKERLGLGESGAREIMNCRFFSAINFNALLRRGVEPPFLPEVVSECDTKYVFKLFLQTEVRDSFDVPFKDKTTEIEKNFNAFTFVGEE